MKNRMKLCLIMISYISATTYCAEKPLNADKIIREAHATGKRIPQAIVDKLMEQQKTSMAQDDVSFRMLFAHPIPEKTIAQADAKTAALATLHNKNLQQKLNEQQPK
jgi:hypothetical protein